MDAFGESSSQTHGPGGSGHWSRREAMKVMGTTGLLALTGAVSPSLAQGERLTRFTYRQGHMGMGVRLTVYAPDRQGAERAARAAFERVAMLDRLLSTYRSDSELMQVNRRAGKGAVPVGEHLFFILQRAQEIARRSEGALDVTTGPFIQLWKEARRTQQLPNLTALREASRHVGWRYLALEKESQSVVFRRDGMQLNLGGLAKGYILEQALQVIKEHGLPRALVEAGGDLVTGAPPPGAKGWTVDVPHQIPGNPSGIITVDHSAVSTSGDGVQYVDIEGTRYSHVVNPNTGLGLTGQPTTTVVTPNALIADAIATTLGIQGLEEGRTFVRTHYSDMTAYATKNGTTHVLQRS